MKSGFAGRLLGLVGGLAVTLLSAGAFADDPVTLTVWSDTVRLPTFAAYQAAHPNVKLNVVTVGDGLVSKLQIAMRAKSNVPDVIFMPDVNNASLMATRQTNYLMDLTNAVPKEKQDEFYPNANVPCMINGKLMCLRNDMAHFILWYNKPQLDKLGFKVPTTWEEYEKLGSDLAALKQGYILGSGTETYPLMDMLVSDGCDVAIPDPAKPDTLKIDLTTDACKKPAAMIDRMIANGSLSKASAFEPAFIQQASAGKLVLMPASTWFAEYVIKPTYKFPAKVLADALPPKWADQQQPSTWSWGGGLFGGWKDTKHPKEVVDLLTWVATNVDSQKNAVTMPADKPASIAWSAKLKADGYYATNDIFDVMLKAADYGNPGYGSLRVNVEEVIGKVVSPQLANGAKLVDLLPALQQELINNAKVNGYRVEP